MCFFLSVRFHLCFARNQFLDVNRSDTLSSFVLFSFLLSLGCSAHLLLSLSLSDYETVLPPMSFKTVALDNIAEPLKYFYKLCQVSFSACSLLVLLLASSQLFLFRPFLVLSPSQEKKVQLGTEYMSVLAKLDKSKDADTFFANEKDVQSLAKLWFVRLLSSVRPPPLTPSLASFHAFSSSSMLLARADPGCQKAFATHMPKSPDFVPHHLSYFAAKMCELSKETYIPSLQDILRVRMRTTGVIESAEELEEPNYGGRVKMINTGGQVENTSREKVD
jgi:hypothetical protein